MDRPKNELGAGAGQDSLNTALEKISSTCNDCGLCRKECEFLKRFGTPKTIADAFDPADANAHTVAFACSLCGLCKAVCPQGVDPEGLFRTMRCDANAAGKGDFAAHKRILRYEARGSSPRYSWFGFPERCDTVFFPGCALPGTRPGQTLALFNRLRQTIPSLGIVLDCCAKPSYDLGRMDRFGAVFGELKERLMSAGIQTVIAACPSCYTIFKRHGAPLNLVSAYEALASSGNPPTLQGAGVFTIHDPCPVRFDPAIHLAVRRLLKNAGGQWVEMPNNTRTTLCCGEGGAVSYLNPELGGKWVEKRAEQAGGRPLLTYCAGCIEFLSAASTTFHILDLIFDADAVRPFRLQAYRSPMTYLNRIRLKRHLRQHLRVKIQGARR